LLLDLLGDFRGDEVGVKPLVVAVDVAILGDLAGVVGVDVCVGSDIVGVDVAGVVAVDVGVGTDVDTRTGFESPRESNSSSYLSIQMLISCSHASEIPTPVLLDVYTSGIPCFCRNSCT